MLFMLAIALAATPAARGASESGWNVFRWGLKPDDVAERLRSNFGALKSPRCKATEKDHPALSRVLSCSWDFEDDRFVVFGLHPDSLHFDYFDGQLYSVTLFFRPSQDVVLQQFMDVRANLLEQYGVPSNEISGVKNTRVEMLSWWLPALEIELTAAWFRSPSPNGYPMLDLSYSDPVRVEKLNSLGRAARRSKK